MDKTLEYRFGNAAVRPLQRQLLIEGRPRPVGARAFDVLLTLIERRERVVRKNELMDCVWPGAVVEENNLQVHISSLRKLLGPQAIATIPGRGYRFTAAIDASEEPASRNVPSNRLQRANGNLPPTAPVLYGRERELSQLKVIAAAHRLVSVVGPGGIGKSVLVQALAHDIAHECPDGAWLVELAPLSHDALVAPAVAALWRMECTEHEPARTLARQVADRRMLIVLDNCEHLPEAASEVATALFQYAPGVRILATSREPLKLRDEIVFRLGGLELPHADAPAREAGSVALLQARVQALDAAFSIPDGDLDEAVEICRHLDGIPLAIEFAAARVPLFGMRGLREQLDDRFRVLTRGARFAQPRHQTLHSALEWSFTLLDEEQQRVFRRLGVFAGGFDLESARRVCSDGSGDEWRVIDHLGDLVDKSLVVAESGAQPRYRLLETTRAFALGKLADAGEVEIARRRHAQAMLDRFNASRRDQFTYPLAKRLAKHQPDLDNLRGALDWAAGPTGDTGLLVALASASAWIWQEAGGRPEGMRRLRLARERVDERTPPAVEAWLCLDAVLLANPTTGPEELALAERAVELGRKTGDNPFLCLALGVLGRVRAHRHDHANAQADIAESRGLLRGDWPPILRAKIQMSRVCVCFAAGLHEDALEEVARARQLAEQAGDELMLAAATVNQEQCFAALERWPECVARGRELKVIVERLPGLHHSFDAVVSGNLCIALIATGDIEAALREAHHAYPFFQRMGSLLCFLDCLAPLAFERGLAADAARIVGCADARLAAHGQAREPVESRLHEKLVKGLTETFGPAELTRLAAEGAALSVESAAALALRAGPQDPPGATAIAAWPGSAGPAERQGAQRKHRAPA